MKMTIPEAVGDQMTTMVEIPKTEDTSKPLDSTIWLLVVVIFDLGQIEKTGTIFFQLILEIKYKNHINNFITC